MSGFFFKNRFGLDTLDTSARATTPGDVPTRASFVSHHRTRVTAARRRISHPNPSSRPFHASDHERRRYEQRRRHQPTGVVGTPRHPASPPRVHRARRPVRRDAHARHAHHQAQGPGELHRGAAVRRGHAQGALRRRRRDGGGQARIGGFADAARVQHGHPVLRAVHAHAPLLRGRHGQARRRDPVHRVRRGVLQRRERRDARGYHTNRGGIQRHHRAPALHRGCRETRGERGGYTSHKRGRWTRVREHTLLPTTSMLLDASRCFSMLLAPSTASFNQI